MSVKRVIVVCKTHLDIGFTDLAGEVTRQYCQHFIPQAIRLARQVNTGGRKRFVWTVGSWLPWHYLATAGEAARADFSLAVTQGHIRWHALPCTIHTELMNEQLFSWGLSLSARLDRQFGLQTIAAKMTDVPGHTIAMVPLLARAGVKYLHLGVNGSSRLPQVPPMFRWRLEGSEIIVHYAGAYGQETALPNGTVLEFFHTNDNMGPPTRQALEEFYEKMEAKYPGARVEAGTLEDFARECLAIREALPLLEQEIGDSWIHGIASDPIKTSALRRILHALDGWAYPPEDAVMEPLLLAAEHTWGMDTKLHLRDFVNWEKPAFRAARQADAVPDDAMAPADLARLVRRDHPRAFEEAASYRRFESSHAEQRGYIRRAVDALPPELGRQLQEELRWQAPSFPESPEPLEPGKPEAISGWHFCLGPSGELRDLRCKSQTLGTLGLFRYQSFSRETVDACYRLYGRDLEENGYWAAFDFGKPGLSPSLQDGFFAPVPLGIRREGNVLTVFLAGPPEAVRDYGCPRRITLRYSFTPEELRLELFWSGKDAFRGSEACWLHMNPAPNGSWKMVKLGRRLDPRNVVSGGNQQMSAVEALRLPGKLRLCSPDAPLVSFGRPNLYTPDDRVEDLKDGFWFNLYNNRWGTNFPQWFEEDMRYEFCLQLLGEKEG